MPLRGLQVSSGGRLKSTCKPRKGLKSTCKPRRGLKLFVSLFALRLTSYRSSYPSTQFTELEKAENFIVYLFIKTRQLSLSPSIIFKLLKSGDEYLSYSYRTRPPDFLLTGYTAKALPQSYKLAYGPQTFGDDVVSTITTMVSVFSRVQLRAVHWNETDQIYKLAQEVI